MANGACPHDCPDTCAFRVTVDDGRAVKLEGRADHPITAGFLCGKVSDYLERVYSPERLLAPLVRTGPKGAGEFREASWDEALDVAAGGIAARSSGTGRSPCCRTRTSARWACCREARWPTALWTRSAPRGSSARSAPRPAPPASASPPGSRRRSTRRSGRGRGSIVCWGWNPMSTAPHLWRLITLARRTGRELVVDRPVPQPHRARRRPAPAAAAGDGRRARARDPARAARRGPRGRGVVPRPRRRLRRPGRTARRLPGRDAAPRCATSRRTRSARWRATSRPCSRR